MLTLEQLRNDATLPEEDWQIIKDGIIRAIRERLVGRQLMEILPLAPTVQEFGYDRMKTEHGDAVVVAKGGDFPRDVYDTERIKFPILKLGDGFTIPREDYLAGQFRTLSIEQMTRRVAEKEDKMIFDGDADFLAGGGALDYAGNSTTAAASWDTATVLQIYDDIRDITGKLEQDKFLGPYSMVVHANEMKNLRKYDTTAQTTVMELIFGPEGETADLLDQLLVSYGITDGNALVMTTGRDVAALAMAEDLTAEEPVYIARQQRFEGNVYERFVPVFYQYGSIAGKSDAIGKIISL